MGRSPSPDDFPRRMRDLERRLHRLERLSRSHTETKTFLVSGDVDSDTVVPRCVLNVNPLDQAQESKLLVATHGELESGSLLLSFQVNGVEIMQHSIGTTWTDEDITAYNSGVPTYLEANQVSKLKIEILSGSGTDLAGGITILTGR